MRTFIILIITLIPSVIFSQSQKLPKYYLNGNLVNFDHIFILPSSIKTMTVNKYISGGEIYIQTKDKNWKFKTLNEFLRPLHNHKQIFDKSIVPIFIVDKRMINEPDSIKIDADYYGDVTLKSLSKVKGVPANCKNLVIVAIELSTHPIIHIRGNDMLQIDSLKK